MITEINNNKLYLTVDSRGAEIRRMRDLHGTDYIWRGDEKYWSSSSPILFPIVGAVRDNEYEYGGKKYHLPKHGFARVTEFKKVSSRTDAVTFLLSANEETKKVYPFDFELYVTYELIDFSLVVKFKVVNTGDKPMPFFIGGHPAFYFPIEEDESFTDYRVKFSRKETANCPALIPNGLLDTGKRTIVLKDNDSFTLDHELFKYDALVFDELKSRSVEVYSAETGRGIKMDFDGFDYFGIWQPYKDGVPFMCLEPWTGVATTLDEGDTLTDKRGVTVLKAGEYAEYEYKVTVE